MPFAQVKRETVLRDQAYLLFYTRYPPPTSVVSGPSPAPSPSPAIRVPAVSGTATAAAAATATGKLSAAAAAAAAVAEMKERRRTAAKAASSGKEVGGGGSRVGERRCNGNIIGNGNRGGEGVLPGVSVSVVDVPGHYDTHVSRRRVFSFSLHGEASRMSFAIGDALSSTGVIFASPAFCGPPYSSRSCFASRILSCIHSDVG